MQQLYTPEQRQRRDASKWTFVQGILAPIQFFVCIVSVFLVVRFLLTGQDQTLAHASILLKTALLLLIMVTGCLWEHDVYGQYLFAPAFFWEDAVSMAVIALHLAYVIGLALLSTGNAVTHELLMVIALAGYATYLVNAAQFLAKLRQARIQSRGFIENNRHTA